MKKRKILVIEPHSDDSMISGSGYLEKNKKNFEFHFLLMAASTTDFLHAKNNIHVNTRLEEYENYTKHFKGKWHKKSGDFDLPLNEDCTLDLYPKKNLVKIIETIILNIRPHIILLCGPSFHHDHTAVYEASIAALRPTINYCPEEILVAENPTYMHSKNPYNEFIPNYFISMNEKEIEKKINNFKLLFPSQLRKTGNVLSPEGIKAWARYRGIEARCKYAEAFYQYFRKI